jgi:hypothetical protein
VCQQMGSGPKKNQHLSECLYSGKSENLCSCSIMLLLFLQFWAYFEFTTFQTKGLHLLSSSVKHLTPPGINAAPLELEEIWETSTIHGLMCRNVIKWFHSFMCSFSIKIAKILFTSKVLHAI